MLIYSGALKQINTKLEILNQEFQHVHNYNPIEHIKSRVKTPGSIAAKLKRHGYEVTLANMVKYCNDIAGIRVICDFTSDIYKIDQQSERYSCARDQGLYRASEAVGIQELPYDCHGAGLSFGPYRGYEGGDSDPDDRDGFLGISGTQDPI